MDVCTIIAKNYVANARVLARSLAATNPGSRLSTLIIDDFSRHIDPEREPFEVLTPEQVGCEPFEHMALRYSVLELSTAVKPWLLRHLMDLTGGPVTYLDPDIKIFGSLARLDDLAGEHGVVLTPHNSRPIPQDGRHPSQVDVMIAGIYNLGYVSVAPRPEVDRLLDWWADRLRRDCRVDPVWGYFVDQRWFDLAPGFLDDIAIVRDPQYNLAYWNLHERRLEKSNGGYEVDGHPLAFFHFSGFDPERPLVLSRHQDRIDVTEHPVLEEVLQGYAVDVLAEGYVQSHHWPYDYGSLADGTRLDDRLREAFDEYAAAHDDRVPSPFTLDGVRAFDAWLSSPAPGAPAGISRAAARIYESRVDLRGAFPDVAGADREAFLEWVAGPGAAAEPLLARGAPAAAVAASGSADPGASSRPSAALRGAPWGINVVGDFRAEGTSGEIARAVLSALDAGGQRVVPVLSRTATPDQHDRPFGAVTAGEAPFTVNLMCVEPEVLPEVVNAYGSDYFAGRYSIGLWSWPLAVFPDSLQTRFSLVEEVWAPSEFTAAALRPLADVPVHVMPFSASPPPTEPRTRAELGLPDGFLFLARVDYRDDPERQNPTAIVHAFRNAFGNGDEAVLVIDCAHTEAAEAEFAELRTATDADERIALVDGQRGAEEALSAISLCDCFVSLHRAEAFGLDLARAMWFGRPVVATGYSGNAEFMTAENSFLVDHRLVAVGAGREPYPPTARWAEPDVDHASRLMRAVFDDAGLAAERAARAAREVREAHAATATAEFVARRLEAIRATGGARRTLDPIMNHPQALARLPKRIQDGPPPAVGGRGGAARKQLRETILRLMKPFTEHQRAVDTDIVTALAQLSQQVTETRLGSDEERAQRLAAARQVEAIPARIGALQGELRTALTGQLGGIEEIKKILTEQTGRDVYLALSELHRRHAKIGPDPAPVGADRGLTGFELRAFSQNGEDGVLAEILRRIGAPSHHFVEFGVESGREGNCVFLADVADWCGLFMEADDDMFRRLEGKYARERRIDTIRARVNAENIESLFAQAGVPDEPDIVSIDIDGQDYWLWSALESYRPRVLIIEYNSSLDARKCLVQPNEPGHLWDGTAYYGASLGALERLGKTKGYRLVHTDLSAVNAFFVRDDLVGDRFPEPDDVGRRGAPNYYQRGIEHPSATPGARYLDLETGKLVRG